MYYERVCIFTSISLSRLDELGPTQPPMMTFKAFMEQCDDSITEEEALRKYSDYKLEFKRQQLNEFFVNHKEEEWWVSQVSVNGRRERRRKELVRSRDGKDGRRRESERGDGDRLVAVENWS